MPKKHSNLWPDERKAIKAIQIAFDISNEAQRCIKRSAIESDRTPSDQIRTILGLPVKKPVRPRLTLSLSVNEIAILARRYGMKENEHLAIKERAAEELLNWAKTNEDLKESL